jgi:hypothetical protein
MVAELVKGLRDAFPIGWNLVAFDLRFDPAGFGAHHSGIGDYGLVEVIVALLLPTGPVADGIDSHFYKAARRL